MDKIIMEIIKNSILFDDNVKTKSYCNLSELHDDIKMNIYDFGILHELEESNMEDIYNSLKKLILLNQLIIFLIIKNYIIIFMIRCY